MGKLIDLEKKKEEERKRNKDKEQTKKMHTAVQMFQCSRCRLKCVKCGTHIESDMVTPYPLSVPYRFCKNCLDEYLEFQKRLNGNDSPGCYWYNEEWIEIWKTWILYHEALKRYEMSTGYKRLLEELTN
jgi:hypothetical protein